jgi:hypothetical protein
MKISLPLAVSVGARLVALVQIELARHGDSRQSDCYAVENKRFVA